MTVIEVSASKFGARSQSDFNAALQSFFDGCKRIHAAYMAKDFPNNPVEAWELQWLDKRARVKHGGAAHSFVDYATGDVLKPAGWSKPAKHARGNIYDEHNGLKFMGPYGPAYLR